MPNQPKNYDLVIIGGGPAGITATAQKKTVAMIDAHHEHLAGVDLSLQQGAAISDLFL